RRDKAKSALTRAEADMKRCVIVAPSPGELNRLPIEEREYVQKGDVVAEIVDLSIIKVSLDVAERDSPFLKKGQALTLSYGLVQPRTLHGTITYISAIAEPSTQTTHIEVSIPNPDRSIRPSQITKTYLPLRKLENVIMIPLAVAIPLPGKTSLEKGHRIWLLENGKGVPREVKLDMDMLRGELVRVAEGLVGGETLITAGRNYIGPNQPVKVINTIPTPRP
ncbi:MAG: efflux RND transporter periplasmic adaptor subunit, partial [Phycisphaerales bacterium]|nr:efflux RND transporter periplasmic adaptor subunit [Phycisphaerales bacterium]